MRLRIEDARYVARTWNVRWLDVRLVMWSSFLTECAALCVWALPVAARSKICWHLLLLLRLVWIFLLSEGCHLLILLDWIAMVSFYSCCLTWCDRVKTVLRNLDQLLLLGLVFSDRIQCDSFWLLRYGGNVCFLVFKQKWPKSVVRVNERSVNLLWTAHSHNLIVCFAIRVFLIGKLLRDSFLIVSQKIIR